MNVALGLIKEDRKDINPNFSKDELRDVKILFRLIRKLLIKMWIIPW